jgi:hypothetical protein
MKKRILSITIFIFLMLVSFNVKAASRFNSETVRINYDIYTNAKAEMERLKCNSSLHSQYMVDKCNTLELQKSTALSYMYNAREKDKSLVDDNVERALEENGQECSTVFSDKMQDILKKAFLAFYVAGPILLILFGSLDMISAVIAGDEKKRKALYIKFIKRSVALVLLFVSPVLVNVIVSLFGADRYSANIYTCVYEERKVTLSYTKVISKGNYENGEDSTELAKKIVEGAAEINKVGAEQGWTYRCAGAVNVLANYRKKNKATVCCADGASAALVLAGIYDESDIANTRALTKDLCGGYGGNNESATGLQAFLITQGWIKISKIEDLQPGDIVFVKPMSDVNFACIKGQGTSRAGHVEVYAGDGKVYNFGNTKDISTMGPHKRTYSYTGASAFIAAYRVPAVK